MSCEIKICCMFEPIHGREPDSEMCNSHENCIECAYRYEKYMED